MTISGTTLQTWIPVIFQRVFTTKVAVISAGSAPVGASCEALVARFARAVPVNVVDQLGALVNPNLLVHVADVGAHRVGR